MLFAIVNRLPVLSIRRTRPRRSPAPSSRGGGTGRIRRVQCRPAEVRFPAAPRPRPRRLHPIHGVDFPRDAGPAGHAVIVHDQKPKPGSQSPCPHLQQPGGYFEMLRRVRYYGGIAVVLPYHAPRAHAVRTRIRRAGRNIPPATGYPYADGAPGACLKPAAFRTGRHGALHRSAARAPAKARDHSARHNASAIAPRNVRQVCASRVNPCSTT